MAEMQIEVILETSGKDVDALSEILWAFECMAITVLPSDEYEIIEPAPGATPLPENVVLIALFGKSFSILPLKEALNLNGFSTAANTMSDRPVNSKIWQQQGQQVVAPVCFAERLWIAENEQAISNRPIDQCVVQMKPGMAFGSGTHATTAMCLEWMARQRILASTLIDYGCGSGILSISALKLGAKKVYGVDYDHQAITASYNNAQTNGVAEKLYLYHPLCLPKVRVKLIMANILANTLMELHNEFNDRLESGGKLVMSGVLQSQLEKLVPVFANTFEKNFEIHQHQEWVLLELNKL